MNLSKYNRSAQKLKQYIADVNKIKLRQQSDVKVNETVASPGTSSVKMNKMLSSSRKQQRMMTLPLGLKVANSSSLRNLGNSTGKFDSRRLTKNRSEDHSLLTT